MTRSRLAVAARTVAVIVVVAAGVADPATGGKLAVWVLAYIVADFVRLPSVAGHGVSGGIAVVAALPMVEPSPRLAAVALALITGLAWAERNGSHPRSLIAAGGTASYGAAFVAAQFIAGTCGVGGPGACTIAFAAGAGGWSLGRVLVSVGVAASSSGTSVRNAVLEAFRDWAESMSLLAAGGLFGVAHERLGWWSVLVAGGSFGFVGYAIAQSHKARRTYDQMVRALGRLPEVAGLVTEGRADRTAVLAGVLGRRLGLAANAVTDVETASLLLGVGRLTQAEPSPTRPGLSDEQLARVGAGIVGEAAHLERAARLIAEHARAYGDGGPHRLSQGEGVVRVAAEFDRLVVDLGLSPAGAVAAIHADAGTDFDPLIVAALSSVVATAGSVGGDGVTPVA